jgi:hypothetical protein
MNKFTLGVVSGASSLALAIPLFAQISSAQTAASSVANANRPVPTQECLTAMVAMEDYHLEHFDAKTSDHKAQMQAHRDAMNTAAKITDEAARKAALENAHGEMRTAKGEMRAEPTDEVQALMEAVHEECGNTMMFHKGMKHGGMKMNMGMPGMGMHNMRGQMESSPSTSTTNIH